MLVATFSREGFFFPGLKRGKDRLRPMSLGRRGGRKRCLWVLGRGVSGGGEGEREGGGGGRSLWGGKKCLWVRLGGRSVSKKCLWGGRSVSGGKCLWEEGGGEEFLWGMCHRIITHFVGARWLRARVAKCICTLPCHTSLVLLPRDTTFGHWRKQLANETNNSTSPRTWPCTKTRPFTNLVCCFCCLFDCQSVPVSVPGSQSPKHCVVWATIVRLLRTPFPVSPSQTQATRPHPHRQHPDPSANRTVGTFCSQAEVMVERHFPSKHPQYVGGLASQKACGVQEWRRRWIACTPSCRP